MKIQLDTTKKTIKIEESIKVSTLIQTLKRLLPKDYKDFILETNTTIINWHEPYIIEKFYPYEPIKPYYPPTFPWYCTSDTPVVDTKLEMSYQLKDGVFNIEV